MMNDLATELVRKLESGELDKHFDMSEWITCGTTGCIAGHALMMTGEFALRRNEYFYTPSKKNEIPRVMSFEDIVETASGLLGIPHMILARHLFVPIEWESDLTVPQRFIDEHDHWTGNYRCDLDTIEKMREWSLARRWRGEGGNDKSPREAARAIRQVTEEEMPYVNWMRAHEETVG